MWNEPVGIRGLPAGIRANTLTRAGGTLMLGTQGGIFTLSSDGLSWTKSNTGLTAASVTALAANENTILAAAGQSGLFRSTNDGQSWTEVSGIDNGGSRP